MGLKDKNTPTSTTYLIKANMTCAVATILSSLAFLSSSFSMANLSLASQTLYLTATLGTQRSG